jgi:hypothetical protein
VASGAASTGGARRGKRGAKVHEWFVDNVVPGVTLAVGGFVVTFLKRLGTSIVELNMKMAVFVEKITAIAEHVEDHEVRLREIESMPERPPAAH